MVLQRQTWTAKFRDADGRVVERSTGCRIREAAISKLKEFIRESEHVRSGIMSKTESEIARHANSFLPDQVDTYCDYLTRRGKAAKRIKFTKSYLLECMAGCGWKVLADLNTDQLQEYLDTKQESGASAAALNSRIEVFVAFGNWLAGKRMNGRQVNWQGEKRIAANPFDGFGKYDANSDRRRQRRALTEEELGRLLKIAEERPLRDSMTIRRGKRKGELSANLRPETVERLEQLGRGSLIYKTLLSTGLRKGELASITVGQCHLDGSRPYIDLHAADEKNRQGNDIPLRTDLAMELKAWIKERRERRESGAGDIIPLIQVPGNHHADKKLFDVPDGLLRILNRDLEAAGIEKVDKYGRTVDVHALRHSFGTMLSKSGVAPRTAQAAMRHSSIHLTMNTYTDPRLLDVHRAVESLPSLSAASGPEQQRATGSEDVSAQPQYAPKNLATRDNLSPFQTNRLR